MTEHVNREDMTPAERERAEGMDAMAQQMMEAGMDVVIGLSAVNGVGIFAVADGIPLLDVVRIIRDTADMIETEEIALIGHATVDVEEP